MHSNGRGEETPEPYRGVVLPGGQQPPAAYGDHVHPAGGTPWGEPVQPDGAPPVPPQAPPPYPPQAVEPADATQMLPPYPGAGPGPIPAAPPQHAVPVADATQMLPPYPGSTPPEPAPADATQALPLSLFHDQEQQQQPYDAYGQQQQPQGYAGQEFPGQQQYAAPQQYPEQQGYAAEQQYADPQSYGGQQQFAAQNDYDQPQQQGPQHDSDYDHLFRNDVPGPEPLRQRIIQPPSAQQQAQQQAQQHAPQQAYGSPPWQPGYAEDGYDDGDGGRRMSPKVLIGIVVAGCVVAGLVVGGLMSGGGKSDSNATSTPSSTGKPTGSASGSSDAAAGDGAESQAKALDGLLKTSGASRSSVVGAVESIKSCKNLPGAAADLRAAATQRSGLVTQLSGLAVDKLPNHAALTTALTKAWQASSAADGHYAAWADQAAGGGKVCKGGHAHNTSEEQAANRESGTATAQKKAAVKLWNSIATKYGLTQRQYSQL
ncbi:hypothetical protein [Streptomyces sp. NBC_01198]|uniref:hypothetical protein n=1 Tax=Streptomyces sp. NBC_01198 TaxID=2903769 RepID=UPI002E101674|nr:hypothetical protein OG702_22255 [Streptomyces sp. NBC_01198]